METNERHPRIVEAASEFEITPAILAQGVLIYDQTLMGDSLAVERGIAAVLAELGGYARANRVHNETTRVGERSITPSYDYLARW